MVLGTGTLVGCGDVVRSSTPILVQGRPAGVLQAAVPASLYHASDDTTAQSLAVVCQELGAWVERAALRTAAQRNLVLEEKNRIARELHDSVLQILYSTGLGIEWCTGRVDDDMLLKGKLTEMRRLTAQAGHELRSVIYTLSSKVAEVGLLPALATLVSSFSEQHGLPISLSADGQDPEIAVLCQNALHRVVRESLMNAYKHAGATHVSVRLVCDHETITVVVQDDGVGLPERTLQDFAVNQEHFGLRTISKQIEELDGRFEIMNGEESGAVVRATVPTRAPAKVGMHGIASAN
jgi:signal transduction histidine kinase